MDVRFIRFLYNLIFPFVLLALLPGFLHRMLKRGKYRHKFGQRFGIYSTRVREKLQAREWTWVHAVSVGEVLIALKLIAEMRQLDPDLHVVLSTTTSTGFALACEKRTDWLEPVYNPVDFCVFANRAVRIIRPKQLILVEAEVWPNLVHAVKHRGASIALVNARLSPRSERRYQKFRAVAGPLFRQLDAVCVQEPEDVARWKLIGMTENKIYPFGSVKFDDGSSAATSAPRDFTPILQAAGVSQNQPVLLGGSTHSGEEIILADCYARLKKRYSDLFFVLVPRHVERSKEIQETLQSRGFKVALRSQISSPSSPDILLVDTTGELRDWYHYATVVFVGKSLSTTGGQNPAEAISAGKPVVVGPHMENFALLVRGLLDKKGILQIKDEADLEQTVAKLLENQDLRESTAARGKEVLAAHRGATLRTAELLASLSSKNTAF